MPRPRKPPRLVRKKERSGSVYWVIRDGEHWHRTGCLEGDTEGADRALTAFKAKKYEPAGVNHPSAVPISDALLLYARDKGPENKRPNEFRAMMERLDAFWGDQMIAAIRGATCREYVRRRGAKIAARNELAMLRAAVNHYHTEHTLDAVPKVTLPPPNPPRMRWLRREEAAKLLWAAWRRHAKFRGKMTRQPTARHLVRLNLIGLYTGTRPGAILTLYWMPNTLGGYVDLDRGVMHRRAEGERETRKQKPPVRIPSRLLAHLRRWKRLDDKLPVRVDVNGRPLPRPIVHWQGGPVMKINKAYRSIVAAADLDKEVTPHVLRHTRATWLMQAGVDKYEAAGSLGMTVEMLETVYGHHHPDFQKGAAEAY